MRRLKFELYILSEVIIKLKELIGHGATLKQALWSMFNKNGRFNEDDGPWIKGSLYDSIRHQWRFRKGSK